MKPQIEIDAHGKHAQCVRFTHDGKQLISAGMDGMIRFWHRPDFTPGLVIAGHTKSVNGLSLDHDEVHLASTSSDGSARVWSLPLGSPLYTQKGMTAAAFHPTRSVLAMLSSKLRVSFFATTTGVNLGEEIIADQRLMSVEWSADGRVLMVGGTGPIHRFTIEAGLGGVTAHPLAPLEGHAAFAIAMRVSPDGKLLASTGGDGSLRVWSTEDWRQIAHVPIATRGVMQLAWHPNAALVFVSVDNVIQSFRAESGERVERVELDVKGIHGLAVSPDGEQLASACADGKLRILQLD